MNKLFFLAVLLLLGTVSGCNSGGGNAVDLPKSLEGTWQFRLIPTAEHLALEPSVEEGLVENVPLVVQGKQLSGELGQFFFEGYGTSESEIHITVSNRLDDGSLELLTQMDLTFNGSDQLEGVGEENQEYEKHVDNGSSLKDGSVYEHSPSQFIVTATKTNSHVSTTRVSTSQILNEVCKLGTNAVAYAISSLTQDAIRPMEGCGLQRVGRGYYLFGRVGPGNDIPVWTQTFWLPQQNFTFCQSKQFYFTMHLLGPHSSIESVATFVKGLGKVTDQLGLTGSQADATEAILHPESPISGSHFHFKRPKLPKLPNFGFRSQNMSLEDENERQELMSNFLHSDELLLEITQGESVQRSDVQDATKDILQNLYDKAGPFALSIAYDPYTNNASIYMSMSHQNNGVFSHPVLKALENSLYKIGVSTVYKFSGPKIDDHWRLRISTVPVVPSSCTTPLVIAYLIGTNQVRYD